MLSTLAGPAFAPLPTVVEGLSSVQLRQLVNAVPGLTIGNLEDIVGDDVMETTVEVGEVEVETR